MERCGRLEKWFAKQEVQSAFYGGLHSPSRKIRTLRRIQSCGVNNISLFLSGNSADAGPELLARFLKHLKAC